ncbi:hypothetical protein RJ641_027450 [Dillenia turbinata]|uniref:Plant heme peroxidase family profile domain-containing protein n=1 Tax=Dillenia turbinata TaxID=194707 RepID=A0AAN8W8V8_9MAGN
MAQLLVGFHGSSCLQAESIIKQVVQRRIQSDHSTTTDLLRMHFNDRFVREQTKQHEDSRSLMRSKTSRNRMPLDCLLHCRPCGCNP